MRPPPECAPFAVARHGEIKDPTVGALAPLRRKGSVTLVSERHKKSTCLGMTHPEAVNSVVAPSKKSSAVAWPRDDVNPNVTSLDQALAGADHAVVLHMPIQTTWGSLLAPWHLLLRFFFCQRDGVSLGVVGW